MSPARPPATAACPTEQFWGHARILGLLAGGVTFGAYLVGSGRSYDYDSSETVGSFIATHSALDAFRRQLVFNNHPLFSFLDHLVYSIGGHSELALRLLPIALGALTVALLVSVCVRRWGAIAGLSAGFVLAANPTFAELSRSVRGYSLVCLAVVLSTLLLDRLLSRPETWTSVAYVVALAAAIATHVYALFALLAQIALVGARGRLSRGWTLRWMTALVLGLLAYSGIGEAMLRSARRGGHLFHPRFPLALLSMLFGGNRIALIAFVLVVPLGLLSFRPRTVAAVTATLTVVVVVLWIWLSPRDLYPRFLIWLAPCVALAAGAAVSRRRLTLVLVGVAAFTMLRIDVAHWTQNPLPDRQAARLIDEARTSGSRPCVFPLIRGSLLGYTRGPDEVTTPAQLDRCAIVLSVPADPTSLRSAAQRFFRHHWQLDARTPMLVFSRFTRGELSARHLLRVGRRAQPESETARARAP